MPSYTHAQKIAAVKRVVQGETQAAVVADLGIASSTMHYWFRDLAGIARTEAAEEREVAQLRRQLAEVQRAVIETARERDGLKKELKRLVKSSATDQAAAFLDVLAILAEDMQFSPQNGRKYTHAFLPIKAGEPSGREFSAPSPFTRKLVEHYSGSGFEPSGDVFYELKGTWLRVGFWT